MHYLPHTPEQVDAMLKSIGVQSTDELFRDIPESIRLKQPLSLPQGLSENAAWRNLQELAGKNKHAGQYICFLGAGAYEHYQPRAVSHLLSRSEFYTAYTPYQPEISQGTLQAIFEYQTMICELTGMDAANASVYDGATALAEASLMAAEATRRNQMLVSSAIHPEYRATMETYLHGRGISLELTPYWGGLTCQDALGKKINKEVAAVVIQYPNFFGSIENLQQFAEIAHAAGALLIVCADPVSLGVLESPGKLGADIVVGEGQSLGLPLSFGGPYLGFMAAKEKYMRRLPGRIVGKTVDRLGREGFVLTLQAREQHIRREKASSNICSNQALCALSATLYLSLLGPGGLEQVGNQCLQKSHYAKTLLSKIEGVTIPFQVPTFKEFVVKTEESPESINRRLWEAGILGGLDLGRYYPELTNHILLCVTEVRTKEEIDKLARVWGDNV
ncbi:aminomethyl-transferring glycine dehydrogenase subunit GcvPA [Thermanaerosceptrum fracticalcis]|uniref:Probable glycine dehydrogenase (decarboxylating) subunit 1 n=1 Tax=Thermanaerosceptrum fracticalcis TaxID=1712410 RepID=A0A7G6DZC3_THEFR|nr:aminomethyl-transferring glycine dehydrogenase subunit GcvPA [Thermanaerosceptrum fracticalcis]QNB45177.1 aminomethyl-transferring glycine dehydrogenase subunit GcvPA [Thermanaerosceptrum fracticalcis]